MCLLENMIFQSEKTLTDIGDKVSEAEKAPVKAAIEKLKETVKGGDTDAIKADTEALSKAFYDISAKLYQQNSEAAGAQNAGFDPNANNGNDNNGDGGVYNADFTDKSDS